MKLSSILEQIYTYKLKNANFTFNLGGYFDYISVTNNSLYIEKICSLSPKAMEFYTRLPMYMKPRANNLKQKSFLNRCVAEVDLKSLDLESKQYRYKVNKELQSIQLAYPIRKNKYFVNPYYLNNFNKDQSSDFEFLMHQIQTISKNEGSEQAEKYLLKHFE